MQSGNAAPIQDDTQNYIAEYGMQNATHTIVQFRRPLETCDPHDLPLGVSSKVTSSVSRVKRDPEGRKERCKVSGGAARRPHSEVLLIIWCSQVECVREPVRVAELLQ